MRLFRKRKHADATGDAIPSFHDGEYRSFSYPAAGHSRVSGSPQNELAPHLVDNLVDWQYVGPALLPGGPGEPDADGCWTGSVVFGEGVFHAFYTGYSIRAGFPQTICHAFSADGVHWTKDPNNPSLFDERSICMRALTWRDPYAFYNNEEQMLLDYLGARRNSGPIARRVA